MREVAKSVGKEPGRMAFTATQKDLDKMFERAETEGTLKEGSGDELVS